MLEKRRIAISVLFLALPCSGVLSHRAWAASATSMSATRPPTPTRMALSEAIGHGMLSFPLEKSRLHTRIAPGYSTIDMNNAKMSGWALTGSANYGLSDHWGVGFMAGHNDLHGNSPMSGFGDLVPQGLNATQAKYDARNHDSKGQGTVALGTLVWDHWTGNGFRLPVHMGLGYIGITETRDDPTLGVKNGGTLNGGAVALGAAPSLGFGKFRAAAYVMVIMCLGQGTEYVSDYNPGTGAENRRYSGPGLGDSDSILLPLGTELTYMPWGLSLGYVAPIDGASTYTLSWTRRWGAN